MLYTYITPSFGSIQLHKKVETSLNASCSEVKCLDFASERYIQVANTMCGEKRAVPNTYCGLVESGWYGFPIASHIPHETSYDRIKMLQTTHRYPIDMHVH